MLTTAWDNINVRGFHRHERIDGKYGDTNFDYTTSMHFSERINADHLDHAGKGLRTPEESTVEDFIPGQEELELIS